MREQPPVLAFFPALPLASQVALGPWLVGTVGESAQWRSTRFRELAERLLRSFSALDFNGGAVVHHRARGVDGSRPSDRDLIAIQAAVRFAALDANDDVFNTPMAANQLATSENGALSVHAIDEANARVVHERGGALRGALTFGLEIGAEPPLPDAVAPLMHPVRASQRLARAVFWAFTREAERKQRRVQIAIQWHAAALSNPHAVTMQQRLIALKTGFEALLGTSNSRECARTLRRCFEAATAAHSNLLPWGGLLWSPRERVDLARARRNRDGTMAPDPRSELEDWFMTLARARNEVIHDGVLGTTAYEAPRERPLSRYAGPLFWIGERVLREAVKATLGVEVLLEGLLLDTVERKELAAVLSDSQVGDDGDVPGAQEPIPPAEFLTGPPRACEQLLAELACSAANQVVLSKAVGGCSASLAAAQEASRRLRDYWVAKAGERAVLITSAERGLLEQAGAEPELRAHFRRC